MKRKRVLIGLVIVGAIVLLVLWDGPMWLDASFATRAHVRFHYTGKPIDATITDAKDLAALKRILGGWCHRGDGCAGCGRQSYCSLTLSDGRRSITYYPARDTCEIFLVGSHSSLSVTRKQRAEFEAIVKKYGMTFPCL